MATPIFTCKGCGNDIFCCADGANLATSLCGKCERGENRTDGYLDGYTESERNNRQAAIRAVAKRGTKQAHKPTHGRAARALRGRALGY